MTAFSRRQAWHTRMLRLVGREIVTNPPSVALQMAYMAADSLYSQTAPAQEKTLHEWYGESRAQVSAGLVHDAGVLVGVPTIQVQVHQVVRERQTDGLQPINIAELFDGY